MNNVVFLCQTTTDQIFVLPVENTGSLILKNQCAY